MKQLIFAALVALSFVAVADEALPAKKAELHKKMTRLEILNRKGYKKNGGALIQPDSMKGCVCFINQQTRVPESEIMALASRIKDKTRINVRGVSMEKNVGIEAALKASDATLGVFLVDESDTPVMLVAPEERWAKVNVAKLAKGAYGKEVKGEFLAARVRKELNRAYMFLCGGATSGTFDGNVMSAHSVEELDSVDGEFPLDMVKRVEKYLGGMDVTPERITTYRIACQEGWAPLPTNDVQKAVWEHVHQVPTKPIKIEYNEKRDKGK